MSPCEDITEKWDLIVLLTPSMRGVGEWGGDRTRQPGGELQNRKNKILGSVHVEHLHKLIL